MFDGFSDFSGHGHSVQFRARGPSLFNENSLRNRQHSSTLFAYKNRHVSCLGGIDFCIYFKIDFGMHLVVLWLPFGRPLDSLGSFLVTFWSPFGSFGSLLPAFSLLFAPFVCLVAPLCSSRHPFDVLLDFGNPFGSSWGSNGNQNAAKAA